MEIRNDRSRNSGAYVGATLLIVIGLCALVANLWGSKYVYESIPLAIGVAFLVAYASDPDDWIACFKKSETFPARVWAERMALLFARPSPARQTPSAEIDQARRT